MPNIDLQRFNTPDALADRVAVDWLGLIRTAAQASRQTVALSGGRIAKSFLAATARLALAEKVSLDQVEFFWGDERCVLADHADSNFKLAKENLLDPLDVKPPQLHPLCCDDDGPATASRVSLELLHIAEKNAAGDLPVLDLIFLGMGEDAHVASLFPEETEAARDLPDIYRPVIATKPPPRRITIGYQVIAAAREVWVVASGPSKAAALEASLKPGSSTPLARVLQSRLNTRIYSDI